MERFTKGQEGVFYDMADADYRKMPGVSNSMLKHIATDGEDVGSPAHFQQALREVDFDSDTLFIGRMVHSKILTPKEPLPSIIVIPENYPAEIQDPDSTLKVKPKITIQKPWHGAAAYCKKWLAEQEARGVRPMTRQQMIDIEGIVTSVANNPVARMALERGKPEVSLCKKYSRDNGFLLKKARLDWVPEGPALVDIKSCLDARKDAFEKTMLKYRYYVQAVYYLDLWNELNPHDQKTNFVFIAVEKFAPYAVNVFDVVPRALGTGRSVYQRNLHLLLTCMETDSWPAYGDDVKALDLPAYAYKKDLEVYS